ncbi:MAG: SDR family oxidoreductase [Chloroflexi bacterium]|nr:MAG: SDR family oxidoreductase [Chloroflexota bacterium]
MKGKVVMVTGASAGMGREVSLQLARSGATVVMVCRDASRGGAALSQVRSGGGSDAVELLLADLSSQQSIRALARDFAGKHDRLDVLVNNVGVTLPRRTETVDGIETVFATNHLAPFLLTNLMLPVLKASAPSRIVTVSSGVQAMARLNLDDLQSKNGYDGIRVYNQTKLLNLLFTYELARRLKGTGVTSNAVEPGFVKTNMKVPFPFSLFSFMRRPVDKGAWISVHAATSPALEGVSGVFLNNRGVEIRSSKASYDEEAARRLWQVSAELTHVPADIPA